jgi:hypothetical protein
MASDLVSDSASDYRQDSFSASDYQSEEPFSVDLLLSRLEEVQRNEDQVARPSLTRARELRRSEELVALQKLTRRSVLLQQLIIDYQQQWCCMLNLREKSNEARVSIQRAVEDCVNKSAAAERTWLGYWGIKKEHINTATESCSTPGWI